MSKQMLVVSNKINVSVDPKFWTDTEIETLIETIESVDFKSILDTLLKEHNFHHYTVTILD